MPNFQSKEINITAVQWTGANLAAMQVLNPDCFLRGTELFFPSNEDPQIGVHCPVLSWMYFVIGTPTKFYVIPPQTFALKWEPAV